MRSGWEMEVRQREGGRRGRGVGGQESNEVGRQVEGRKGVGGRKGRGEGGRCCEGRITYSTGVFGTQLIKQRRGEMQKG